MANLQGLESLLAVLGVQTITMGAVLGLGRSETVLARFLPYLVSAAAGVLLAAACLDLLPDVAHASIRHPAVWVVLLISLLALFCAQAVAHGLSGGASHEAEDLSEETAIADGGQGAGGRVISKRHPEHVHGRVSPVALLMGSSLHSLVDGVALVTAFAAGSRSGWLAAVAIGLHELPHRLGDFALLHHLGFARRRAAQVSIAAGAAALVGWGAVQVMWRPAATSWLLPVSAAAFLYIALVDLLPELHASRSTARLPWQIGCLFAGAALMAALSTLPGE